MDIKVVDQSGQEIKEESKEISSPETEVLGGQSFLNDSVADMFDIKPSERSKYSGKINTLIDYAKSKTDQHTPEGIKWAIRSLALKVGTPPLGEKLITYLTTYAYLAIEKQNIEKQMNKYENADN